MNGKKVGSTGVVPQGNSSGSQRKSWVEREGIRSGGEKTARKGQVWRRSTAMLPSEGPTMTTSSEERITPNMGQLGSQALKQ